MLSNLPEKIGKAFGSGTLAISNNRNNRLNELIDSKYTEDLIEAIKILFVVPYSTKQYLQNKELKPYISKLINLLPKDDLELKRLCQILITEFAAQPNTKSIKTQGDVLLLATAPIFKDLTNMNTTIKLNALKTFTSLRMSDLIPILLTALKKIQADKNPIVRKSVAIAIIKMYHLNNEDITQEHCQDIINFLLKDTAQTRLYAIYVVYLMTNNLSIMHKYYFQMIKDLVSLNQFDLEKALQLFYIYCIRYFESQDKDLNKFLDQCELFLKLPYPGVIMNIAKLYIQFPSENRIKKIIKTVIKFLNIGSESKFIILQLLYNLSIKYPQLVKEHYRALTILQIEKLYCKLLKLEILILLIDEHNFNNILEELLYHARSNQPQLVAVAVKLLSKTTIKFPKFIKRTIKSLIDILKTGNSDTKNHVIASFCNLINTQENKLPLLAICLQNIDDISDIRYKSTVIKLLRQELQQIPTIAAENLRKLSLTFINQHENVKYEILLLSHQLIQINQEIKLELLHQYLMTLSKFDSSLLVRDLYRTLAKNINFQENILVNIDNNISQNTTIINYYPIGTLSHLIGIQLNGLDQSIYLNENTSELRKIEQPQQQPQQQQQQQQKNINVQQNIQPQKEQIIQIPQQQQQKQELKKVDEEIKKHYQNLDQVLDNFFAD